MAGTASSVTTGLHAALLLARGRTEGLRLVATDAHATTRSFLAMILCVPMLIAMRLVTLAPAAPGVSFEHAVLRDLLVFTVSWVGFVLLTHQIAGRLGLGQRWPGFVAAWNWCNLLENLLVFLGSLPALLGIPSVFAAAAQLFALGWALWIEWYVTRTALGVGAMVAVWMVLLDEIIGLFANGLAQALGAS